MEHDHPESDQAVAHVSQLPTTITGSLYARADLRRTTRTATMAFLFTESSAPDGHRLTLKLGTFNIKGSRADIHSPADDNPRSVVILRAPEFEKLLDFLEEKVRPLKSGAKKFVVVESDDQADAIRRLKVILNRSSTAKILELIDQHGLLPQEVLTAVVHRDRLQAIKTFEEMLERDALEREWQAWFEQNEWVLGSDFITVLDERDIDTSNIADYLVQAADRHLDIIEIKRPGLNFWSNQLDHGNLVPHADLVKAWTQAQNYIFELEREMNNVKTKERYGGCPIAKPRALLIHGRSAGWVDDHYRAQRLLNGGLSAVQILTYDQVLSKAKRIVASQGQTEKK